MADGGIHILRDDHTASPWWPTEQRLFGTMAKTKRKVFTDCCSCWMLAHQTMCRYRGQQLPIGGFGFYCDYYPWDSSPVGFEPSYFEGSWRIECDPASGCKVNRRKLNGAYMRSVMHYG